MKRFAPMAISIFLLAACTRSQESRANKGHPETSSFEAFPEDPGEPELDHWFVVHLQNRPAGFMHVVIARHQTPRGLRRIIEVTEEVTLRREDETVNTRTHERAMEDDQGHLLRLRYTESEAGGDPVVIEAGKAGQEMVTLRGPEITRRPFEEDALGALLPYPWILGDKQLKPNDEIRFRTYVRLSAGYSSNHLKVIGKPADDSPGILAEVKSDAMPGVVQHLKLDPQFHPLQIESRLGALVLRFERTTGKPTAVPEGEIPDLTPLMQIKSNVDFPHRNVVLRARYRIDGLPGFVNESYLTGPGQKVVGHPMRGTFIIDNTRLADAKQLPFPLEVSDPAQRVYLESTAMAQANDADIAATARKIVAGAPNAWSAARRLRRWVSKEISGSMGMGFASAREVFRRRRGDCSEQAVLLATLARAVGIPSRCVMGLVYTDHSFGRHMWTEVWTGEWRSLDAAMGTDRLSAAWIRLGVYSLKLTDDRQTGMGGILAFASDLKLTVLEHEIDSP